MMVQRRIHKFFTWYERRYKLNLAIAAFFFVWQLSHLYWLAGHVVAARVIGRSYFELSGIWQFLIVIADYTEVPAIIFTSLIYINALRKKFQFQSILFLLFLNIQWLHIFWITDEFVIKGLRNNGLVAWPLWLVWFAIAIDYLELPVIFDTFRKLLSSIKK
jgi:hypothetical protein